MQLFRKRSEQPSIRLCNGRGCSTILVNCIGRLGCGDWGGLVCVSRRKICSRGIFLFRWLGFLLIFKLRCQSSGSVFEFTDAFAQGLTDFWKIFRAENDKNDHQQYDHVGNANAFKHFQTPYIVLVLLCNQLQVGLFKQIDALNYCIIRVAISFCGGVLLFIKFNETLEISCPRIDWQNAPIPVLAIPC